MKQFLLISLLISCRCFSQLPAEDLKIRIGTTLTMGKFDSAIYWGRQLVAAYGTADNYLLLGSLYEIKKDTTAANIQYGQALAVADTNKYKVVKVMAQSALDRGNMNKAISFAHQSIEDHPVQPEVHFLIATIYQRLGEDENAQAFYRKAYQLDSSQVEYQQQMYLQEYSNGNIKEALRILAKTLGTEDGMMIASGTAVSIDSSQIRKIMALASGYLETDQYEKASELLLKLTENNLGQDTAYFMLAEAYAGMHESRKAAGAYTSAIGIASKPGQLYFERLSTLYEQMGEPQLAVNTLIMGADKGIAGLITWRENYNEGVDSISKLNAALETAPEDQRKNIYYSLAQLYVFTKHQGFALQVLDELRKNGESNDRVKYLTGLAQFYRGRLDTAENISIRLVALHPKERDYQMLLLTIVFNQRKYKAFLSLLDEAESKGFDVTGPELTAMKLKSYMVLGKPEISKELKNRLR